MTNSILSTFMIFTMLMAPVWGEKGIKKRVNVKFYQEGRHIIITINEDENGKFKEFFVVKLIKPVNNDILKNNRYKMIYKNHFLIFVNKYKKLIFTIDKAYTQKVFKQKRISIILVNGIAHGTSDHPITLQDILGDPELLDTVFETEQTQFTKNGITVELIEKNPDYEENKKLDFFK